jgi:hypothetical protein
MLKPASRALCGLGVGALVVAETLLTPGNADAAGGVVPDPNAVALDRYVYYPSTEVLAEDEV